MRNRFYQAFDTERLSGRADADDYRSPFQIDRDRVLHTTAFRRMQSKTQVFWSGEYDFYRTRLTHSLEVAQIGRSICNWLAASTGVLGPEFFIDGDLVEAVCLSHDLGHPPFGHAGERTLNDLMAAHGGFEGNAQTLRLLTERIFAAKHQGMDPTRAFLDGVLKYKSLWTERVAADGAAPRNHFLYDQQQKYLDWALGHQPPPAELTPGAARDGFKSIECQVMDWADDTAYSLNDLADSVRAGFLSIERIERWAARQTLTSAAGESLDALLDAIRAGRIDGFVGRRIGQYIRATSLADDLNFLSATTHRYRFKLVVDAQVRAECTLFKQLAYQVVFLSPQLKQLEHKGSFMLRRLWEVLAARYLTEKPEPCHDFQLLPEEVAAEVEAASSTQRARLLCDFLADLTDSSAARTYQRLFVPNFGSIGDLLA